MQRLESLDSFGAEVGTPVASDDVRGIDWSESRGDMSIMYGENVTDEG
mgnify:CR=1 FL=1